MGVNLKVTITKQRQHAGLCFPWTRLNWPCYNHDLDLDPMTLSVGLLHERLIHGSFHKYWSDPLINFLLPLEHSMTFVYVFQDGCRTESLRKICPSYCWWLYLDPNSRRRLYLLQISLIFSRQCNNHRQNNTVISVGSHFVLNGALQLEQSVALTFAGLPGSAETVHVFQCSCIRPKIAFWATTIGLALLQLWARSWPDDLCPDWLFGLGRSSTSECTLSVCLLVGLFAHNSGTAASIVSKFSA